MPTGLAKGPTLPADITEAVEVSAAVVIVPAGPANRRATAELAAGPLLAGLVGTTAGHRRALAAQPAFIAAAGAQRHATSSCRVGCGLSLRARFVSCGPGFRPCLVGGGLRLCSGRFPVCPRLVRRRTGRLALIPGSSGRQTVTPIDAGLCRSAVPANEGDDASSSEARKSP